MNFEMMKVLLMIGCFFVGERIERRTWVVFSLELSVFSNMYPDNVLK